ncbi:hypothetical protein AWY79_11860 [Pseudodesulfovibrio indicus]|uniref:Uncharacterized protein n=1 Tax=Pseudodesulfovibrio indicus TaxID=1716143 RepID=A0ABM5YWT2_9BACT|nr:hypothetical protein AWY79_11860 [Pseudodesulfovibrio indicus]
MDDPFIMMKFFLYLIMLILIFEIVAAFSKLFRAKTGDKIAFPLPWTHDPCRLRIKGFVKTVDRKDQVRPVFC